MIVLETEAVIEEIDRIEESMKQLALIRLRIQKLQTECRKFIVYDSSKASSSSERSITPNGYVEPYRLEGD